jgi:hypothetical protein
MLKKFIGWCISWTLYWIGHAVSRTFLISDKSWWVDFWYPVYNWLMITSGNVQSWGGAGAWKDYEESAD